MQCGFHADGAIIGPHGGDFRQSRVDVHADHPAVLPQFLRRTGVHDRTDDAHMRIPRSHRFDHAFGSLHIEDKPVALPGDLVKPAQHLPLAVGAASFAHEDARLGARLADRRHPNSPDDFRKSLGIR